MNKIVELYPYTSFVRIDCADDGRTKTSIKGKGDQSQEAIDSLEYAIDSLGDSIDTISEVVSEE